MHRAIANIKPLLNNSILADWSFDIVRESYRASPDPLNEKINSPNIKSRIVTPKKPPRKKDIFLMTALSLYPSTNRSKPLAPKKGIVIAKSIYIIDGILNFEKNGNNEKKGLYSIEKKEPKPVIRTKIVITQNINSDLSGFFSKAPTMAKIKTTKPT